jgi:hypothetical protein
VNNVLHIDKTTVIPAFVYLPAEKLSNRGA